MKVIGFEGQLRPGYHATWGAAAVRVDDELVNPVTGLRRHVSVLDDLKEKGALHVFSRPIEIDEAEIDNPLLLIAISEASPYLDFLIVEKNRLGGIVARAPRDGAICSVVRDEEALRQYSRDVAHKVLSRVLADSDPAADSLEYVRVGLALDPFHPYLNAMRAYLLAPQGSPRADKLARACTRGAKGQKAFDEFLSALRSENLRHELRYDRGVAEGGGLDADIVGKIFNAITTVTAKLKKHFREDFAFLPEAPPPRLIAMQASSAKLEFAPSLQGRPMGERVARYMELRALERALQGDTPPELLSDREFDFAMHSIVRPSDDTGLRQKPLGAQRLEVVAFEAPKRGTELEREEFSVLGIVTGALSDAGKLEVRVFPGVGGRLMLPTDNDGDGGPPAGLEFLAQGHVELFKLAQLQLLRESDDAGRERFFLSAVEFVADGRGLRVDAFPSSVMPGAFRLGRGFDVMMRRSIVKLGDTEVAEPLVSTRVGMYPWLVGYARACERFELAPQRKLGWTRIARVPTPSARAKALVSLHALGGKAPATLLAEEISRRFDSVMRVNNTRREVIHAPELMAFTGDDKKGVDLLPAGRRWVNAYLQMGGNAGKELDE